MRVILNFNRFNSTTLNSNCKSTSYLQKSNAIQITESSWHLKDILNSILKSVQSCSWTLKKLLLDDKHGLPHPQTTLHTSQVANTSHTLSHTQRWSHPKFHFATSDGYEHKSDCL